MPNDLPETGLRPHCGAEAALAVGYPKHKVGREQDDLSNVCDGCRKRF